MKVPKGHFHAGAALSRSLAVLGRNAVPFGIIALLVAAPRLALELGFARRSPGNDIAFDPTLLLFVLDLILVKVAAAAIVYGTVRSIDGHRPAIGDCVRTGLVLILPVITISLLVAIGTFIGYLIVVLPGIYLEVIWWVAIPAAVAERLGVNDSLRRSRELVRGHFLAVFWLFAVVAVLKFAISAFDAGLPWVMFGALDLSPPYWTVAVALYLLTAAVTAFAAVLAAVSYHDLRIAKDGVSTHQIAAVFE